MTTLGDGDLQAAMGLRIMSLMLWPVDMVDSVDVDRSCLPNDDGKIFRSLLLLPRLLL